jgi:hypothetical protein
LALGASLALAVGWQLSAVRGAITATLFRRNGGGIAATGSDGLVDKHLSLSALGELRGVAQRVLSAIALVSGGSVAVNRPVLVNEAVRALDKDKAAW